MSHSITKPLKMHLVTVVCLLLVILTGCSNVAITGRSQFNMVPDWKINADALQQYNSFLSNPETKLSTDAHKTAMVQRVGRRIADAVELYMRNNGMADELEGYSWEFNLVESKDKNAWAMPGGKVVIYTGILDVTQDEEGLAVVMGHEIAHAVARHGAERYSQQLAILAGGIALNEMTDEQSSEKRALIMAAYGAGATVGIMLPYSRTHENEADRLGLIFMAMAGYNPETAVDFWTRMAEDSEGKAPPEFLSTHPGHETRIRKIKEYMPEAMTYYRRR